MPCFCVFEQRIQGRKEEKNIKCRKQKKQEYCVVVCCYCELLFADVLCCCSVLILAAFLVSLAVFWCYIGLHNLLEEEIKWMAMI